MKQCIDYFNQLILGKLPVKAAIAGGALRDFFLDNAINNKIDIDLYVDSQDKIDSLTSFFNRNARLQYETNYASRYVFDNLKVDLIHNVVYDDLEDIINSFDFTVCCCAVDNTRVVHHPLFFDHLKDRMIVLNDNEKALKYMKNDVSILSRLQKYIGKGFFADKKTLLQIASIIKNIDTENIKLKSYDEAKQIDENVEPAAEPAIVPIEDVVGWMNDVDFGRILDENVEILGAYHPNINEAFRNENEVNF